MKLLGLFCVLFSLKTFAQAPGLVIHAGEFGVEKFHRYDNKVHPYPTSSVWTPHIMPDNGGASSPIVFENADHSISVQFTSLEQLLLTVASVSASRGVKIAVLNINGHGVPGGMWFPKDEKQRNSFECYSWNQVVKAPDKVSYDQYYEPITKEEIMELRAMANKSAHYGCVTGATEWKEIVKRNPMVSKAFMENAQIHFESCLVGLGPVGEIFTSTVGSLLLDGDRASVKTSVNFGLGDWSMPEGMGFWDYFTDDQLKHDEDIYVKNKKDREIMKKGVIRVATIKNGRWVSNLVADQDFMLVGYELFDFSNTGRVFKNVHAVPVEGIPVPARIRIPGTNVYAKRSKHN